LQYSVTSDWPSKVRATAKRIAKTFPSATILVYATNQQIGAAADNLRKELRKDFKLTLDIHDRNWFLERLKSSPDREKIAEALAADIVDPLMASREVIESKAPALNQFETKAAVLHLQLQWEDDTREKGLTKLCFEALVKSVLQGTTSEKRMSKASVRNAVAQILPDLAREVLDGQVNSALDRLDKRAVRQFKQDDEVCLNHDETIRVRDGLIRKDRADAALNEEIQRTLLEFFSAPVPSQDLMALCIRVRRILDTFLLKKGEEFAAAVAHNRTIRTRDENLDVLVTNDFASFEDLTGLGAEAVTAVRSALHEVIQKSEPPIQQYLRQIADGYTLFGFLRAAPDVQKAVQGVFRHGQIWLDTSVILPVLAETLLEDHEQIVSRLLRTAVEAGMELRVTSGVVEEIERHINRCLTYYRLPKVTWVGGVPFLYAMYALSGRDPAAFGSWTENFCGSQRARDDVMDYLREEWQIGLEDLGDFVDSTEEKLRWEVARIWRQAHEARRATSWLDVDDYVIDRLANHDVECFLGVLGKRSTPVAGELGYAHWWLTFDRTVRDFEKKLYETLGSSAPKAPVMSPDFLADYLAVGPGRGNIGKNAEGMLPVAIFDMLPEHVPAELLEIADDIRKEHGVANERLIRRKLRDALDEVKGRRGDLAKGGFTVIREKLERAFKFHASKRKV